jgi:hypothetical protein
VALGADATDEAGILTLTSGTTPTTGVMATVSLSGNYSSGIDETATPLVALTAVGSAAGLGLSVSAVTTSSFTISCTSAPAASTAYTVHYLITIP